jgi:hypothetical protein
MYAKNHAVFQKRRKIKTESGNHYIENERTQSKKTRFNGIKASHSQYALTNRINMNKYIAIVRIEKAYSGDFVFFYKFSLHINSRAPPSIFNNNFEN